MAGRKVVTPSFEIVRNGEVLERVPMRRARLVIGSEAGADLRLKHPAIAPRHLEVAVLEGRFIEATNLAGDGRVLLGGHPLDRARLREGDELDLGPILLRLSYARTGSSSVEDAPTDADAPAPVGGPPSSPRGASTPSGSRLGARRRAPARPEPTPSSMDVDLGDQGLDPTPVVTIEPPGGDAQRVPLRVGTFVVGSGRCAFRLNYPGVATAHAEMMVMPDGHVYLKHLAGGGQVTLCNGAPLQFSRWNSGDRMQVGPVTLSMVRVPASEVSALLAAPPPAPAPAPRPRAAALPRLEPEPARRREEDSVAGVPPPFAAPLPHKAPPPSALSVEASPPVEAAPPVEAPSLVEAAPTEEIAVTDPQLAAVSPPPAVTAPPDVPAAPTAAPPAAPLVRVRRKSTPAASPARKRPLRQANPELVSANRVEVDLSLRGSRGPSTTPGAPPPRPPERDFLLEDIDIDYRPPVWKRYAVPGIIALLVLVIGVQFWLYNRPEARQSDGGPRVARGQGPDADLASSRPGDGPMVVGQPRRTRRGGGAPAEEYVGRGAGGYGGAFGTVDPADDWDPSVPGRTFASHGEGEAASSEPQDPLERLAAARAATDEGSAGSAPPTTSGGGGWVEMKDVEAVIWQDRKKLRYCTTTAREDDPDLAGVMWLTLTLGTDGRIREASLESRSQVKNDALFQCLRRQLSTMRMPTPSGGPVSFSYPFELTQ